MQVLAVDIGTGTQDVLLFDSRFDIENGFKLVMPSPTMMIYRKIKESTRRKEPILLTGVTMGGGPSHWAVENHIKAGCSVYATPDAARSFNDDLDYLISTGIRVVSADEARRLPEGVCEIVLKDFDFDALQNAFSGFGVSLKNLEVLAVGVFDHGAAPPDYSDRKFRFEYLDRRIRKYNRLSSFAFRDADIPPIMTRFQAVAQSARNVDSELVVMDTAPAAVLGATLDKRVMARERNMIANIGNFHTLAFRLGVDGIEGVFEHHTGLLDKEKMEYLLREFAAGTLTDDFVFADQGHGALIMESRPFLFDNAGFDFVVTGPRRNMMRESSLRAYFAAPYGDMMLMGCFGMLAAVRDLFPAYEEEIQSSLMGLGGSGTPPWEID